VIAEAVNAAGRQRDGDKDDSETRSGSSGTFSPLAQDSIPIFNPV